MKNKTIRRTLDKWAKIILIQRDMTCYTVKEKEDGIKIHKKGNFTWERFIGRGKSNKIIQADDSSASTCYFPYIKRKWNFKLKIISSYAESHKESKIALALSLIS